MPRCQHFREVDCFIHSFAQQKFSLFPLRRTAKDIRQARELAEKRQNLTCAITGKPAKYIDPVTQLPYSNVAAFKEIR